MDDKRGLVRATARAVWWGCLGSLCGAVTGGFFSVSVGAVIETVDRSMAGLGCWLVFVASAILSAPGGAVAGAVGAVRRRPLHRLVAGTSAGLLFAVYPSVLLWLHDDTSWPYSLFVLGGGQLAGAVAGAFVSWPGQT